jgi:hypothetical protein
VIRSAILFKGTSHYADGAIAQKPIDFCFADEGANFIRAPWTRHGLEGAMRNYRIRSRSRGGGLNIRMIVDFTLHDLLVQAEFLGS